MKRVFLAILIAIILHAAFLLFGGVFFPKDEKGTGRTQQVELLSDADAEAEKKKEEEKPKEAEPKKEEMETEDEKAPDAAEIIKSLEASAVPDAPALEAASLGAIEQALNAKGGAGDFAESLSFSSGGRIGGTGKAGGLDEKMESAFSMAEIDQKPRAVVQAQPAYPAEMRGRKVEGLVTVIFLVDASGKVTNPKVEKSNNPAFERPALDAVRQWRFEPGIRGGQRVACKMRVPIRFQKS